MRLIHYQCLKQWFHQKRQQRKTQLVHSFYWKNLECELCKQAYPYETRHRNKLLNIIQYELPESDLTHYVVLESISSNSSKVIHVLDMTCAPVN